MAAKGFGQAMQFPWELGDPNHYDSCPKQAKVRLAVWWSQRFQIAGNIRLAARRSLRQIAAMASNFLIRGDDLTGTDVTALPIERLGICMTNDL